MAYTIRCLGIAPDLLPGTIPENSVPDQQLDHQFQTGIYKGTEGAVRKHFSGKPELPQATEFLPFVPQHLPAFIRIVFNL